MEARLIPIKPDSIFNLNNVFHMLSKIFKERRPSKPAPGELPHDPFGLTVGETLESIIKSLDKLFSGNKS